MGLVVRASKVLVHLVACHESIDLVGNLVRQLAGVDLNLVVVTLVGQVVVLLQRPIEVVDLYACDLLLHAVAGDESFALL